MNTRNKQLLNLIPLIPNLPNNKQTRALELFQNEIIRPILKFQHEIILELVLQSVQFFAKTHILKMDYLVLRQKVQQQVSNNQKLRNQLLGMVLGLMTTAQLKTYFDHEAELRKRIFSMLTERIHDGLQNQDKS